MFPDRYIWVLEVKSRVNRFLQESVLHRKQHYYQPSRRKRTRTVASRNASSSSNKNRFQLSCCGIQGPADWPATAQPVPASCCSGQVISGASVAQCTVDSPTLHKQGCLTELVEFFKDKALVLGGVGLGIAFVQVPDFLSLPFFCLFCLSQN